MKSRMSPWAGALVVLVLVVAPCAVRAQGSLSVQGLGYPPGQFSARAMGTGGALAEFDPASPVNPAALLEFGSAAVSVQMAPEFRRVTDGNNTASSSTQRFPVFIGALPFSDKFIVGVSSSTLLDRSWQTTSPQQQILNGDTVDFNSTTTSDGSVNDIAFTAAYMPVSWLRLGVAAHAINGRDIVTTRLSFADTVRYGNSVLPITNTFTGNALSVGAELVEPSLGGLAVSFRRGGPFEQTVGDTLIARANVPDEFGLGLVYTGFTGTVLAFRTAYDSWSRLGTMDSASGTAMNSWDSSVGVEFTGPRLGELPVALRVGSRWRDLPFPADGHQVREASLAGGLGFSMAQGHASFDLGLVRMTRSAGIGISESAWTMNAGLTIRP
ncbi:MAG: hypothetical protein WBQ26_09040 [Gemmatimonadaceae bacterium]|nr:hypothetical protein [Gemmatimonadaceae bacterium]